MWRLDELEMLVDVAFYLMAMVFIIIAVSA